MKSNKQRSIKRNSTLILSIASLAFIISLFFQIILGASKWKNDITSQMKMYIYLEDSVSVKQINALVLKFKKLSYLNKINGKSDIEFKSKNKTANEFISKNSENFDSTPFLHKSCIPIEEVDFRNDFDKGQMDIFGENHPHCEEGMCGV